MKLSRHRRAATLGVNMTPMIDIVFLLIIFFMTVSQITQIIDHPVKLPDVIRGGETLKSVSITYNLTSTGRIYISGKHYSLEEALRATESEFERVDRDSSRIKAMIRGDRDCPGQAVNQLNRRLSALGIKRVSLAVMGQQQ